MKKTFITIMIAVILSLVYIIFINYIASDLFSGLVFLNDTNNNIDTETDETVLSMTLWNSAAVTSVNYKWYGTIMTSAGETEETSSSILYLFKVIKLPVKGGGVNLKWMHIIVLLVLLLLVLVVFIIDIAQKIERRYAKKNEMVY